MQITCILVGEVQRYVVHRIFQPASRFIVRLPLHTSGDGGVAVKPHVLAVDEFCFFRVVHVVYQLGEARPFLQVAHHILAMILLNSSSKAVIFSLVLGNPCWCAIFANWFRLLQPPSSIRICFLSSCVRAAVTFPCKRRSRRKCDGFFPASAIRFMTVFHSASVSLVDRVFVRALPFADFGLPPLCEFSLSVIRLLSSVIIGMVF